MLKVFNAPILALRSEWANSKLFVSEGKEQICSSYSVFRVGVGYAEYYTCCSSYLFTSPDTNTDGLFLCMLLAWYICVTKESIQWIRGSYCHRLGVWQTNINFPTL